MEYTFIISNGCTEYYQNTLSRFTNFVQDLYTQSTDPFEIAVSEVMFKDNFASPYIPSKELCPPFIHSQTLGPEAIADVSLSEIPIIEKIYLPPIWLTLIKESRT